MICGRHILAACYRNESDVHDSYNQIVNTLNMFDELGLMSKPVVLIGKLLFISGREAQDTGQVQPTSDWKTVCGSHHH